MKRSMKRVSGAVVALALAAALALCGPAAYGEPAAQPEAPQAGGGQAEPARAEEVLALI